MEKRRQKAGGYGGGTPPSFVRVELGVLIDQVLSAGFDMLEERVRLVKADRVVKPVPPRDVVDGSLVEKLDELGPETRQGADEQLLAQDVDDVFGACRMQEKSGTTLLFGVELGLDFFQVLCARVLCEPDVELRLVVGAGRFENVFFNVVFVECESAGFLCLWILGGLETRSELHHDLNRVSNEQVVWLFAVTHFLDVADHSVSNRPDVKLVHLRVIDIVC